MTDRVAGASQQSQQSDGDKARHPPFNVRAFGLCNWRGLWTLYAKEVQRFMKVFTQTVMAPVVTTLLFYTIFTIALGGVRGPRLVADIPFAAFLAPGLIMMAIIQNSFANTSSSLMISKIQGNVVDVLMPPMGPLELSLGFAGGGVTRGIIVGISAAIIMMFLVPLSPFDLHNPALIIYHAVSASIMLSLLGMIAGIWADKFDHMAAITNFVIMPLSFLSGTFYSIQRLPETWQFVAHFNPFFYLIDGFRNGFIGHADTNPLFGMAVAAAVNLCLLFIVYRMFASGYKLKA
jgi:ABC-2 type transport system permease protein